MMENQSRSKSASVHGNKPRAMKRPARYVVGSFIPILLFVVAFGAMAQPGVQTTLEPHPTRLIAKIKSGQEAALRSDSPFLRQQGLAVRKRLNLARGLIVLDLADTNETATAGSQVAKQARLARLAALRNSGLFEYVEPDYAVRAHLQPSDSAFQNGTLWGLTRLNAEQAWGITTGSTNVVVGVIDSGVRSTHQDLASQLWRNPGEVAGNNVDDDGDGYVDNVHGINAINKSGNPSDDNDHGTHVAGTIGAAANNAGPVVGVCWNVRLMACKFLDSTGQGYTSDAIECIDFAASNGARILNCSWGGGDYSQALYDAIAAARNTGVLVIAAAGNDGRNNDTMPDYPASYNLDNIISVAALDANDSLPSFSNYGQTSVDLAAPGVGIYSCTAGSDSSYDTYQGTSMAAPHVSGVAALLLAQNPAIATAELRQRLLNTTVSVPALSGRCVTGGRVNAYNALTVAPDGVLEVSISTRASPPLNPGSSTSLYVTVADLTPVTNASVTGQIVGGSSLTFANNGVTPDATAGDNIYSAILNVPMTGSNVSVRVVVSAPGKQSSTNSATFANIRPPANDLFANRSVVTGTSVIADGSNIGASKEVGEPYHAGNAGGKSVWWSWIAPANGSVNLTTIGSGFNTLLAVYIGTSVSGLSLVANNDDQWPADFSAINFTATAGTSYAFAVDGFNGAAGPIRLNLKMSVPPPNDQFANRMVLSGSSVTTLGNNVNATKEAGEPLHAGNSGGKSVWWTWTAPNSGPVAVTTAGSSFDTTLGVYTGTVVSGLTLVAGDDDSGGWPASAVSFNAKVGTAYQIAVDGFDDGFPFGAAEGDIRLNLSETNRLRLLVPQPLAGGGYRVWIASADSRSIDPARGPRMEIHALTNVAQQLGSLTRLAGTLTYTNGRLWLDDLNASNQPARFYRAVER
jgi:subtilisin family serine protease